MHRGGGRSPPQWFVLVYDLCSAQLGRECYPRGKCVASELGKEQTVGQKKLLALVFLGVMDKRNDAFLWDFWTHIFTRSIFRCIVLIEQLYFIASWS